MVIVRVCVRTFSSFGLLLFVRLNFIIARFYLFWPFISIKLGKTGNLLQFVSQSTKANLFGRVEWDFSTPAYARHSHMLFVKLASFRNECEFYRTSWHCVGVCACVRVCMNLNWQSDSVTGLSHMIVLCKSTAKPKREKKRTEYEIILYAICTFFQKQLNQSSAF